jgi:hypothetical protein
LLRIQKALTFQIMAPKGPYGLSFVSYAGDSHVSLASSKDCYEAFFQNKCQAIIFDLAKGVKLIQNEGAPYKLARLNTYGNCYLVGINKTDDSDLSTYANVISYNSAASKYDGSYENEGINNSLFKLFYSFGKNSAAIDKSYEDMEEEYQAALKGEDEEGKKIDYALLSEPYVTRLLKEKPSYKVIYSFVTKFKEVSSQVMAGGLSYAHYPETGLFVSKDWDQDDSSAKALHENFFKSYDNMALDLERNNGTRVASYLQLGKSQNTFDAQTSFGADLETLENAIDGSVSQFGVNALGFSSYSVDLASFYLKTQQSGLDLCQGTIADTTFSKYYNG